MILEPCCYRTRLTELLLGNPSAEHLITFGDTDLSMLMDYFVSHSPGCDVFLLLVSAHQNTIRTIARLMDARIPGTDCYLVRSFTLYTQGENRTAIQTALATFREQKRMLVVEGNVSTRCLCVGNGQNHFVLQGSIPQEKNNAMQIMTLTTTEAEYNNLMRILNYQKKKR